MPDSTDLTTLQRVSWAAQQKLAAYPKPSAWTEQHHDDWPADWAAYRQAATAFQQACGTGEGRYGREMQAKAAVRHDAG